MNRSLRTILALAAASAALAIAPASSSAIVGGHDAGSYPSVARITFGKSFLCTGTLIAPNWVLTAGHCGSITGAAVASPAAWPAPLIDVQIGGHTDTAGEQVPVSQAVVEPDYLATSGYDVTLLKLSRNAAETPTPVSGSSETALWSAGTSETIVGWGTTSEGGDTPSVLQEASVPVTTDAYCSGAYSAWSCAPMGTNVNLNNPQSVRMSMKFARARLPSMIRVWPPNSVAAKKPSE